MIEIDPNKGNREQIGMETVKGTQTGGRIGEDTHDAIIANSLDQ
jgi:hypothetical protein